MKFDITQHIQYTLVETKVEKLDASNASELKVELQSLNKSGVNSIILDCSKTKYCDSSGLSAILTANRLCKDTNGKFVLCGLQANVSKMIQISQLDKVLAIVASKEEASALLAI
jgi:anti-sigma B factor antagonist